MKSFLIPPLPWLLTKFKVETDGELVPPGQAVFLRNRAACHGLGRMDTPSKAIAPLDNLASSLHSLNRPG